MTGAARGLGEAIARRLHADGFALALADIDRDGAERVAGELGDGALAVLHDIRELDSWELLLAEVREKLGDDVHALVNNAARTEFRSFWDVDVREWDDVLATNLRGTYLGCRVVGAYLRDRGSGRIVNLASVAGQASRAVTGVHYATSKAAIVALTRHAATELAPHGVTVNAVAPAAIDGPMVASVPPERIEAMLQRSRSAGSDDPRRSRPSCRSCSRTRPASQRVRPSTSTVDCSCAESIPAALVRRQDVPERGGRHGADAPDLHR